MYYCKDCRKVFESDWIKKEEVNNYPYEETYERWYCPFCDSEEIEVCREWEIQECEECGEEFVPEYDDEVCCRKCQKGV